MYCLSKFEVEQGISIVHHISIHHSYIEHYSSKENSGPFLPCENAHLSHNSKVNPLKVVKKI